jgi:tripartite-type tricarboxylate transporter receptor subunit TctC
MTATDFILVQYRGGGSAMTDLVAGRIDLSFGSLIQTLPLIKAGKLRALGAIHAIAAYLAEGRRRKA